MKKYLVEVSYEGKKAKQEEQIGESFAEVMDRIFRKSKKLVHIKLIDEQKIEKNI